MLLTEFSEGKTRNFQGLAGQTQRGPPCFGASGSLWAFGIRREVNFLAKETMQAVNAAEQQAQQLVRTAKEESEKLVSEASGKGSKLISDSVKEARKRADVLLGVARADGEKIKATAAQETEDSFSALRQEANSRKAQAIEAVRKIVLGQS